MIVVDSSVALQWLLPEEGTAAAEAIVGAELAAPDVIFVEVANVLAKKVRAGNLSVEQAKLGLRLVGKNIARIEPSSQLAPAALELSVALGHPVYDCIFLACAIALDAKVATKDEKFRKRASQDRHADRFLSGDA